MKEKSPMSNKTIIAFAQHVEEMRKEMVLPWLHSCCGAVVGLFQVSKQEVPPVESLDMLRGEGGHWHQDNGHIEALLVVHRRIVRMRILIVSIFFFFVWIGRPS